MTPATFLHVMSSAYDSGIDTLDGFPSDPSRSASVEAVPQSPFPQVQEIPSEVMEFLQLARSTLVRSRNTKAVKRPAPVQSVLERDDDEERGNYADKNKDVNAATVSKSKTQPTLARMLGKPEPRKIIKARRGHHLTRTKAMIQTTANPSNQILYEELKKIVNNDPKHLPCARAILHILETIIVGHKTPSLIINGRAGTGKTHTLVAMLECILLFYNQPGNKTLCERSLWILAPQNSQLEELENKLRKSEIIRKAIDEPHSPIFFSTVHKAFCVPVTGGVPVYSELKKKSPYMRKHLKKAASASFFFFDEWNSLNAYIAKFIHDLLCDLCGKKDKMFGGKPVVMAGDPTQTQIFEGPYITQFEPLKDLKPVVFRHSFRNVDPEEQLILDDVAFGRRESPRLKKFIREAWIEPADFFARYSPEYVVLCYQNEVRQAMTRHIINHLKPKVECIVDMEFGVYGEVQESETEVVHTYRRIYIDDDDEGNVMLCNAARKECTYDLSLSLILGHPYILKKNIDAVFYNNRRVYLVGINEDGDLYVVTDVFWDQFRKLMGRTLTLADVEKKKGVVKLLKRDVVNVRVGKRGKECIRIMQFPLRDGLVRTIASVQGHELKKVIACADVGKMAAGLYVAITRVFSLKDFFLFPGPPGAIDDRAKYMQGFKVSKNIKEAREIYNIHE